MSLRKRSLPGGWYPLQEALVRDFLDSLPPANRPGTAIAAVAPHAGWYYAGRIAGAAVAALDPSAETVVIIGGHIPAGMAPLFFEEDGVETPLGPLEIDVVFRDIMRREIGIQVSLPKADAPKYQDNTIEVLLPMVKYFFQNARILPFRLPAEAAAFIAGEAIQTAAELLERKTVVIGSTDLTHYGEAYGFTPKGWGADALDWVQKVNDRRFIQAVLKGASSAVLARAEQDRSACSAGAVLGAMGFAHAAGADTAKLLAYGTSAEAADEADDPPDTFVGYGAMAWYPTGY